MNRAFTPLKWIAGIGFILSVLVHLASLAGIVVPGGSAVYALHVGIFVVWFPTIIALARLRKLSDRPGTLKDLLHGIPEWMYWGSRVLFAYAFINFFLAVRNAPAHSGPGQGPSPHFLRGSSGHWMFFYGFAYITLSAASRRARALRR